MTKYLMRLMKQWFIMQVVFSQSPAGRKRVRSLIGAWLLVLAVIFVLMSALLYMDEGRLNKSYKAAPEAVSLIAPAR